MVQSLTGVGLVWLFPCAAWKGATYCFTTKITNYFIEGWSCRELSGRPRCGAGAGGNGLPHPLPGAGTSRGPGAAQAMPTGSTRFPPEWAKGAQGMEKEEGEHVGQGLTSPWLPVPVDAHTPHGDPIPW